MKKSFALFLGLVGVMLSGRVAAAQEFQETTSSSESATVVINKDDTALKASEHERASALSILQKLENLASDDEQKAQLGSAYEEATEKKIGFIAQVVSVKDQSIKVTTNNGEIFMIPDKSTTLVKKDEMVTADTVSLSEWFVVDDWLVVIGVEDGENFLPRRITTSPESLAPPEQFMQRATVKTAQKTKLEAIPAGAEAAESYLVTAKTKIQNSDGSELALTKLTKDTPVVIVGTVAASGGKTAGIIRTLSYIE